MSVRLEDLVAGLERDGRPGPRATGGGRPGTGPGTPQDGPSGPEPAEPTPDPYAAVGPLVAAGWPRPYAAIVIAVGSAVLLAARTIVRVIRGWTARRDQRTVAGNGSDKPARRTRKDRPR